MRILIISQYFPPDVTAAAYRISDTHRLLREWGHEVRVITSTPHKGGLDSDAMAAIDPRDVIRVDVAPLAGRATVRQYLSQYFGFAFGALRSALQLRAAFDYQVVWASSPPLFLAIATIFLRITTGKPIVFDVRDIWPESAVGVGKLRRGSVMFRAGRLMERAAYAFSDALTCVSKPMSEYLRSMTKRPVRIVYNGIPSSQVTSADIGVAPNADVFCYAGNLGYAQGLDRVLHAFAKAAVDPLMEKAEIHLVGTGAVEGQLRGIVKDLKLEERVTFHGVLPKRAALEVMQRAGCLLIPLVESPAFARTVPSKVFDCMGVGRPIIASVTGEAASILSSTGANITVQPDDVSGMAAALVQMRRQWAERFDAASRNVEVVLESYSREAAVKVLERSLVSAAEGRLAL